MILNEVCLCLSAENVMNDTLLTAEGSTETNDNIKLVDIPQVWTIIIVAIMVIVVMLTIVGNIAVMVVLCYSNVLNSIVNSHFLISLSIADLLVATLVMPCALDAVNTGTWRCGQIWGMFNGFGNFLFCISSIMHLMMLSIDRYLAIARPLFYPLEMTKSRAIILCFVLWAYSAVWAFLPLFGVSSYECFISYIGWCKAEDWSKYGLNFGFAISVVSGTYGLALISMVYVYWKIARVIRKQLQRIKDVTCTERKTSANIREESCPSTANKQTKMANKLSRNKGVVTLLVVTLVYLVCWSPFCILLFVEIGTGKKIAGPYGTVAMLVGFANSCCNPVIYSIKYRRFRIAVVKMLGKTNFVLKFSMSNAGMSTIGDDHIRRILPLEVTESRL